MKFECAYIPIGVPTFHIESAQKEFEHSKALLESLCDAVQSPDEMLLSVEKLSEFLQTVNPQLAIVQNVTFANAAYISEVVKRLDCPVLLWTLREPVIDGGRLRLNSLTGAFSAGNTLAAMGRRFEYVFGSPAEAAVRRKLTAAIDAAKLKASLQELNLVQIGHTPQGFGFGRADDCDMLRTFGVTLHSIEARELIERAKGYSDAQAAEHLGKAERAITGLSAIPEENRLGFARLYKAYFEYCAENNVGALSSRCWPDFFTSFGTPVCAVLAMLNDFGIPAACEADSYGALSMYCAQALTGSPAFFGDPVSMDEDKNTITFWHCGTAACSLARSDTGAVAGVHCNRKIGPTLDFGCKPCERATILRIGKKPGGDFRLFLACGEILDMPKQFNGTSLVVKTDSNAANIINNAVKDGWEPHFAVSYGDISAQMTALGNMLGIDVISY